MCRVLGIIFFLDRRCIDDPCIVEGIGALLHGDESGFRRTRHNLQVVLRILLLHDLLRVLCGDGPVALILLRKSRNDGAVDAEDISVLIRNQLYSRAVNPDIRVQLDEGVVGEACFRGADGIKIQTHIFISAELVDDALQHCLGIFAILHLLVGDILRQEGIDEALACDGRIIHLVGLLEEEQFRCVCCPRILG